MRVARRLEVWSIVGFEPTCLLLGLVVELVGRQSDYVEIGLEYVEHVGWYTRVEQYHVHNQGETVYEYPRVCHRTERSQHEE